MTAKLRARLSMRADLPDLLFDEGLRRRLRDAVEIDLDRREPLTSLVGVDLVITGWGCRQIDDVLLADASSLRAIVHACGSVRRHLLPGVWERGITVSSAADANAIPVAEFTLASILLAGKRAPEISRRYSSVRSGIDLLAEYPTIGNLGRRVGVVGASRIGRRVIEMLRPFDVDVAVCDPFLSETDAQQLGATLLDLDRLLSWASIVSLHAPMLPATRGMIDARALSLMREGATLINTARGGLVDHDALIAELTSGRISAVLDVTDPEPLPRQSPLFDLPNVVLTPHLAGAQGTELRRLGSAAVGEVERIASGLPPAAPVTLRDLTHIA